MKLHCLLVLWLVFASLLRAEVQAPFPLWPDGAPGALGKQDQDVPTLTPYLPESGMGSGAAMVILPGGGYGGLAPHEGKGYAEWLVTNGISCFVVKYRLGAHGYRHPRMLEDAARAVRLVRSRAAQWAIDPKRVGIVGFSRTGFHYMQATVVSLLALYFVVRAVQERRALDWVVCGMAVVALLASAATVRRAWVTVRVPLLVVAV